MASAFREVTVLYVDVDWCEYVVKQFQPDMAIKTINLAATDSDDHSEMKNTVVSCHVVLLLATSNFLVEMKKQRHWLVPSLQMRDSSITTVVAATIDVPMERLTEVADAGEYYRHNWTIINIEVSGQNIEECFDEINNLVNTNSTTLALRCAVKGAVDSSSSVEPSSSSCGFGTSDVVQMIPKAVEGAGEKVALLFSKEKAKDSVTVYAGGVKLQTEHVNPYTVTFIAPEINEGTTLIQVNISNVRFSRVNLYTRCSTQFTSVELLRQIHAVNSNSKLDKILAETFNSSLCSDRQATMIFSKLVQRTPRGKQDGEFPTLLHWAAANGLSGLCSAMLSSPGAHEACCILNCNGDDVADLAKKHGHNELSDVIYDFIEPKLITATCDPHVQKVTPCDPHVQKVISNNPPDQNDDYVIPESVFTDVGADTLYWNNQTAEMPSNYLRTQFSAETHTILADKQQSVGPRTRAGTIPRQQKTVSGSSFQSRDSGISNSGDTSGLISADEIAFDTAVLRRARACDAPDQATSRRFAQLSLPLPPPVPMRRPGRRSAEPELQHLNATKYLQDDELYSDVTHH